MSFGPLVRCRQQRMPHVRHQRTATAWLGLVGELGPAWISMLATLFVALTAAGIFRGLGQCPDRGQ
jgi:hypothetical protein